MSKPVLSKLDHSVNRFLKRVPGANWVRKDTLHTFSTAALCLLALLFATTFILPRNPLTVQPLLAGIVTSGSTLIVLEPENGSIVAPMTIGTDSNASGNKYVYSTISNTSVMGTSTLAQANSSKVLGSVLQAMTSSPIPPPVAGCPLGNTTPVGQANPSEEAEPMGAVWCFPLVAEPTTRVIDPLGGWTDNFQTNVQMGALDDGNMDYHVFNSMTGTGGVNDSSTHSKMFINNNHWMIDMLRNVGVGDGATMRPNHAFKFENGKLTIEADVAAGIPCYQDGCNPISGGDNVWPEVDWSTSPQPTGQVTDNLYVYGQFASAWASGCRLSSHRSMTCALEADHNIGSLSTGDQPPCFGVDPSRLIEMSGFQQCGSTHFGGAVDFGGPSNAWRQCQNNQMDMFCRDRFRFEWTQDSLTVYVNGIKFFQDAGWPAARQIPTNIVNGSTPVYAYFGAWGDFTDNNVYRFHYGRIAVNPHNSDGSIVGLSAAPSYCPGQPQNTCQMNSTPPPPAPPPPTITTAITSPTANTTVSGVVSVSATATGGSGISKVELFVDGVSVGIDNNGPYNFSWNTSNLLDGTHQLLVKATDSTGNLAQSTPITVTTSNGHPTLPTNTGSSTMTFNAQTAGQYTVWTRMFATDANSDSYWLQIDNNFGIDVGDGGVPFGAWTWVNHRDGNTSQRILINLTAGQHTIKIIGREANTKIDTVLLTQDLSFDPSNPEIVDSIPPVVTISSPTNNASLSGTATISLTATDDHAVSRVDLLVDNIVVASQAPPSTGNSYSFSLDTTKLTPGSHTLFAKATDLAGNSGSSSILSINVSNSGTPTPPPPPPQQPIGDLNGDNKVNILDLSIMLRDWGANGGPADLNHDGTVNIIDLSILLGHWTG